MQFWAIWFLNLTTKFLTVKQNLIYEDDEIEVYLMPTTEELRQMILEMLEKKGALTIKEIHNAFEFPVSEDKIRKILSDLISENRVVYDYHTKKYIFIK